VNFLFVVFVVKSIGSLSVFCLRSIRKFRLNGTDLDFCSGSYLSADDSFPCGNICHFLFAYFVNCIVMIDCAIYIYIHHLLCMLLII